MLKQSVIGRLCVARAVLVKCQGRWKGSKAVDESPLRRLVWDAAEFDEGRSVEPELSWATEPYAARPAPAADDDGELPQHTSVLLFPSEDAYHVGMGSQLYDVPAARELYDLASSVVGWDVRRACTVAGGQRERAPTAVLVTALAALEAARERRPAALQRARAAAGRGVGELAALVWAGALPLERALTLLELRREAERAAHAARPGRALQLWLAPAARLPQLLAAAAAATDHGHDGVVCQVAQYLYPGCRVVAGDDQAMLAVERRGAEFGVRRALRLGGPALHCALMAPVQQQLRAALRAVPLRPPRLRVLAAGPARAYRGAEDVRRELARAAAGPVRWEQALQALYARPAPAALPLTLAVGPHRRTRHELRRVNARAADCCVGLHH